MTIRKQMTSSDLHEATQLDLWNSGVHGRFFFIYNPPKNKPKLDWLEALWDGTCVALGDFNAHSTRWGYSSRDAVGNILEEFIDSNPVEYIPNEQASPTFLSYSGHLSHPDLVLTHIRLAPVTTHTLKDAPGGAGHKILIVDVRVHRKTCNTPGPRWARWNLKKANWNAYKKESDEILPALSLEGPTDRILRQILTSIQKLAQKHIPRGAMKKYKPFWTPQLRRLKLNKDQAKKDAEESGTQEAMTTLHAKAVELKEAIKAAKRNCYISFLKNLDFRRDGVRAHTFLSGLNGETSKPKNPIVVKGRELVDDKAIASAFCSHYAAVSNFCPAKVNPKPCTEIPLSCQAEGDYETFNGPFTINELDIALKQTKTKKSPGPDGVLPEFLLNLGLRAKETVLNFLNCIWKRGDIPAEWRKAEIIPIHKKGKPKDCIASFRPIALTSTVSKVMERMALSRLTYFIKDKNLLSSKQAGFRRHRSTVDQVVQFTQAVKDGFQHHQSTLAVFVDFSTAFDRVWRKKLVYKLAQWGVHGKLFKFLKNYLSQRYIRVRYDQALSGYKQTRQGVPQGAVLSPTLFNIMIDDLITELETKIPGLNVLLYADDLLIWATSSSIPALETCMNKALTVLSEWSVANEMTVNPSKTNYQLFTISKKAPPINLRYSRTELTKTDSAVYLGVKLDNTLTWNKHFEQAAAKGCSRLKLLKRLAGVTWGASQDVLKLTYTAYVRPAIIYGCEAAVTASQTAKMKLERIQNMALRNITGAAKSTPIAAMQSQTGVEPIIAAIDRAALTLHEKLRRTDVSYWRGYTPPTVRLTSQQNFTHALQNKMIGLGLELECREDFPNRRALQPMTYSLTLMDAISKNSASIAELRAVALETIHSRYPTAEWLHVYTDGSAEDALKNGGAGVYSALFQISAAVGMLATNFDSEVAAIQLALQEIDQRDVRTAVLLVDSQAAILSLGSSQQSDTAAVVECLKLNAAIMNRGSTVHLQWIPSHCGVHGNEEADRLAKEGASREQPDPPKSIATAKLLIKAAVKRQVEESLVAEGQGKMWEVLTRKKGKIPAQLPRREFVALFRLATGHDFLQKHLKRIGVVSSPVCPLCSSGEMDAHHLMLCPSLEDINEVCEEKNKVERYWAARRRMSIIMQTGVG